MFINFRIYILEFGKIMHLRMVYIYLKMVKVLKDLYRKVEKMAEVFIDMLMVMSMMECGKMI
jgi:hypothetical protein